MMIIQCVCNIYLYVYIHINVTNIYLYVCIYIYVYIYIIHNSYEQVQNVEVIKGSERFLCFNQ